jgi:uncharacterized protein (TIGR03492 family)
VRVLFVSNGHGEAAIAERIAGELRARDADVYVDHLALVGDSRSELMREVGPRQAMPSGGLIAMGSVGNIVRDLGAGLLALTLSQYRFLRAQQRRYDIAVAVGDVYALIMTLATRVPAVFVGTAKSVSVAPYGPFEERTLRHAALRFVRDEPTTQRLESHGMTMERAANVITDLFANDDDPMADNALRGFSPALALFPGSRESAYADARFLLDVVRSLARKQPQAGAALSIARGLDPQRFAQQAARDGWSVREGEGPQIPFVLADGDRPLVRAWRGTLGALLARVVLVLGQAGTANEAAAAAGIPVVAFERDRDRKSIWYRKRQRGLLGEALVVLPGELGAAVSGVDELLHDPARRAAMGATGRERMGSPGGAGRIAARIAQYVEGGC